MTPERAREILVDLCAIAVAIDSVRIGADPEGDRLYAEFVRLSDECEREMANGS